MVDGQVCFGLAHFSKNLLIFHKMKIFIMYPIRWTQQAKGIT